MLKLILTLSLPLLAAGICADDMCGEAQHYREDRPTRPSAGQLQAGHGAGALQVVRESHGGTEQPVSFWTLERRSETPSFRHRGGVPIPAISLRSLIANAIVNFKPE